MKRFKLFSGWIFILVGIAVWNFFDWRMSDGYEDSGGLPFHIPVSAFFVAAFLWYLVCFINAINEWDRRPVLLFGRYIKTAGPGLVIIEPLFYTTLEDVPVQDLVVDVDAKHVQTMDNVSVGLIGALTYCIDESKVKDAVVQVEDVYDSVMQRALSTLTDTAAATDLDHLLENRVKFCTDIANTLRTRVAAWGVDIKAFELKSFEINDEEIEKAIAMKARAVKEAAAELARAEMQTKIARAINTAAGTYNDMGRWLKGLETLVELCRSAQNNTILIPSGLQDVIGNVMKSFGSAPAAEPAPVATIAPSAPAA